MDRRDRSRSRATTASMAALAAAAAAGESGAENGTAAPMDEDQKPSAESLLVGGPSSPPPTPAVPVSARRAAASPAGGGGAGGPSCQAERCGADLTDARRYHRRHKVCEAHSKAPVVIVAGLRQRFCQQCSRFQELSEFDDVKKSCRKRLAGHNERRRKSANDPVNGGGTAGDGWRHGDQGHPGPNPQMNNLEIR